MTVGPIVQMSVVTNGDLDTMYLLDSFGNVWQGWQERKDLSWEWMWKPVNLPKGAQS